MSALRQDGAGYAGNAGYAGYAAPGEPLAPGTAPYSYAKRGTNVLAVVALVTALVGLAIVPILCGHISLGQIKRTGEEGSALAVIGLILGYLELIGYVLALALLLAGIFWAVNA